VTWSADDIGTTVLQGGGGVADRAIMTDGIRSRDDGDDVTVTLSGLSEAFPAGFRILVYIGHGGSAPDTFEIDVGAVSLSGTMLADFDGTWNPLRGGTDAGNYVDVTIPAGIATLTVNLFATGSASGRTAAINGITLLPFTVAEAFFSDTATTGEQADPALAQKLDFCNIQFPTGLQTITAAQSLTFFGQIFEGGRTNATGSVASGVEAQFGFFRAAAADGSNPVPLTSLNQMTFVAAIPNPGYDFNQSNDEYQFTFQPNTPGQYRIGFRYRLDGGPEWTMCDENGAGANDGLAFSFADLGVVVVTP
jgi:hypothetical protein